VIVLDTDHASELGYRSAAGLRLLTRLAASGEEAVITAITVEEQLRGRLAEIHRQNDPHAQVVAYERLVRQVELHASWLILPWDADAADRFKSLRSQGVRVGTQDLKIACVALAHDATLLTRNVADFAPIPRLRVQNWLD
jgi:tRNA(fMet)-specific endonuclease VapC